MTGVTAEEVFTTKSVRTDCLVDFLCVAGFRSSFLVSGGRPSFFLRFCVAASGARDGFVRPICAAVACHG